MEEMDTITARQSLILCLHYREGWSLRRIAKRANLSHEWVRQELQAALSAIAAEAESDGVDTLPLVEGCFSLWCSAGPRQQPRMAALSEEALAQDLERRMDARAADLAAISECMGVNASPPHKRNKGHAWTAWELAYLNATARTSIPPHAYRCKIAGRYSRLCNEIRE